MNNPLQAFLDRQGFAVLDGGLATELETRGADLDHELWSARLLYEAPEMIEKIHYDFLRAGADVIATASYQASIEGFERVGHEGQRARDLIRLSVDLALQAREAFWSDEQQRSGRLRPLVAASVGPYGACLADGSEYHGEYGVGKQELLEFHHPRMDLLADSGADLFAFETIPSRLEAEALLELLAEFPDKWAWLSFSCRDDRHLSHGEPFAECAALADGSAQLVAVGVNCSAPRHIAGLLESAAGVRTPLLAYPNSGEEYHAEGNFWSGEACTGFEVADWFARGARLLGGCCRTSLDDIVRIRERLFAATATPQTNP